ncbi:MAG: hypothetical protein HY769_08215 [Candidatus Stahlbacteria bacterium]|nr:hypothetical protein [Candidatus Stahlbacteria bacterium]
MDEEIHIIEYLKIIKKKWKIITLIFIIAEVVTLLRILILPSMYESTATILPPESIMEGGSGISSRIPSVLREQLPTGLLGGGTASQVIIAILKSRKMREKIREEFNDNNCYEKKLVLATLKNLKSLTTISMTKEGIISVSVRAKDPHLAAELSNLYVYSLDKINDELKVTSLKPIVTVLDPAIPPDIPCSPKVKFSLVISGILALFVGVLGAFFMHYIETIRLSAGGR